MTEEYRVGDGQCCWLTKQNPRTGMTSKEWRLYFEPAHNNKVHYAIESIYSWSLNLRVSLVMASLFIKFTAM
jgi:hypothetical protein